jgi:hypothetical protein
MADGCPDLNPDRRSIVVTVRRKLAQPPQGQALPRDIAGVPVDVRQASPEKRMEIEDPQGYAAELHLAPARCRILPTSGQELLKHPPARIWTDAQGRTRR